jgi:hypothetical protein
LVPVATREPAGEWLEGIRGNANDAFGVAEFVRGVPQDHAASPGTLGRLVVHAALPLHVSLVRYQRVIATQRAERGQRELVFVISGDSPLLAPATVRCRALDATTREPLAHAPFLLAGEGSVSGALDADGSMLATCRPGWNRFELDHEGYERLSKFVLVQPGENDLGDLRVEAECHIEGFVHDEQGQPAVGQFECELADADGRLVRPPPTLHVFGNQADGTLLIDKLSRGIYRLSLHPGTSHGAAAWIVDTRKGAVEGLDLPLPRGVAVTICGSEHTAPFARFAILDANGGLVCEEQLDESDPRRVCLAPGRYNLELLDVAVTPRRVEFEVRSMPCSVSLP